jgi:hypothetical protein
MEDQHQHEEEEAPVPGTGNPMFDGVRARRSCPPLSPLLCGRCVLPTAVPNLIKEARPG